MPHLSDFPACHVSFPFKQGRSWLGNPSPASFSPSPTAPHTLAPNLRSRVWIPHPFPSDSRAWSESLTPTDPLPPPGRTSELSGGAPWWGVGDSLTAQAGLPPSRPQARMGHLPGFPLVTECCGSVSHPQTCLSKPEHAHGVSRVGGHGRLRSHGGVGGPCEVRKGLFRAPCNARGDRRT